MRVKDFSDFYDYDYYLANDSSLTYDPLSEIIIRKNYLHEQQEILEVKILNTLDSVLKELKDPNAMKDTILKLKDCIIKSYQVLDKIVDLDEVIEEINMAKDLKIMRRKFDLLDKLKNEIKIKNPSESIEILNRLFINWPKTIDDLGGMEWPDDFQININIDECIKILQNSNFEKALLTTIKEIISKSYVLE